MADEKLPSATMTAIGDPTTATPPALSTGASSAASAPTRPLSELQQEFSQKEKALLQAINSLSDVTLKNQLTEKITKEQEFVENSGIDALNDKIKSRLLSDGSSGLTDYQRKSLATYKTMLQKHTEAELSAEILTQIQAIHNLRLEALQAALQQEEHQVMNRAYDALMKRIQPAPSTLTTASDRSKLPHSQLLQYLHNNNNIVQSSDPKKIPYIVHYDGVHLKSNDPVSLGLSAVGLPGTGEVQFDGTPQNVLIAIRAALSMTNADSPFSFYIDPKLRKAMKDKGAYPPGGYEPAMKELAALDAINEARKIARATKNNVFNKNSTLSNQAHVFNKIPPFTNAQEIFVKDLPPEQQAQLAEELKDQTFPVDGKPVPGNQFIQGIAGKSKLGQKMFDEAYAKQIFKNEQAELSRKTPEEIASSILTHDKPETRNAFYEEIKNMSPPPSWTQTKEQFIARIRAHLIDKIIEKYYQESLDTGFFQRDHSKNNCFKEVKALLSGTTGAERREAFRIHETICRPKLTAPARPDSKYLTLLQTAGSAKAFYDRAAPTPRRGTSTSVAPTPTTPLGATPIAPTPGGGVPPASTTITSDDRNLAASATNSPSSTSSNAEAGISTTPGTTTSLPQTASTTSDSTTRQTTFVPTRTRGTFDSNVTIEPTHDSSTASGNTNKVAPAPNPSSTNNITSISSSSGTPGTSTASGSTSPPITPGSSNATSASSAQPDEEEPEENSVELFNFVHSTPGNRS